MARTTRYASQAEYDEALAQRLAAFLIAAWNRRWPAEAISATVDHTVSNTIFTSESSVPTERRS